MRTISLHENQYYDIHAPEYKLQLEFCDKKEVTFVIVKFVDAQKDERVEEIHLDNEQLVALHLKLTEFLTSPKTIKKNERKK